MSVVSRDDRVVEALLAATDPPDYTDRSPDELYARITRNAARQVEDAVDNVHAIGALRVLRVPFRVICRNTGVPLGTAHRWHGLWKRCTAQTKGEK